MNKLFTKIAALALGAAMAVGVGVAVSSKNVSAAHATDKTFSTVGGSAGSYKLQNTTTDYWQTDAGSNETASPSRGLAWSKKAATLTYTPSVNVTALSLVGSSNQAGQTISYKIGSGSSVTVGTMTKENNKTYTFSNFSCSSGSQITISITAGSKSTWVKSITITESSGPTKLATPTGVSYDSTNQKVIWNSVSNASSYKFSSNNGSSYTSTSTNLYFDVSSFTNGTTYNCKVVAVGDGSSYTDSDAASYSFTKTAPTTYDTVTVTGGSQQGTNKGSAYIQCSASATGTSIPASPSFTWYVTETNSYGTTTSVTNKASIDNNGKVTFDDSCTVYVWALAPDGSTHNTSGYAATASGIKGTSTNPYTVTEAVNIANALASGANNGVLSYVTGVITGTPTVNGQNRGTFEMTDGNKTIKAYSINDCEGSDSTKSNYIADGYTVVVGGAIINYNGNTPEVGFASGFTTELVSSTAPASIKSIDVKTAPTKTAYKSGETFVATGLVITVTYTDDSTADVAYADSPSSFSFDPSTITAAGNVTITYQGKTCTQAVTLITVTNVTGVASAPSEVYKDGSIDPSDVTLNVTYSDSSVGTVTADSVTCDTSATGPATATATYNAATGTKSATFNVTVKNAPTYDYISDEIIYSDLTATSTGYSNFSNLSKTTEAVYKGNTSLQDSTKIGFRSGTTSGQSQHSGIVTTTSGGLIYQITVTDFDHATRILDVYGSNTVYSDPNDLYDSGKGTKLGSLTQASQSLTVTGDYAYVGVRSNDGLIKVSSISFTWKVEGAANPLIENPTLSTGSATSIIVGKTAPLTITTNPIDSDEKLTVTSDDPTIVSVSGNDRSYTLTALATGSATVTVAGVKGVYQSSVVVTVVQAQKTYEDKILTATSLGLAASYADSDGSHSFEDVEYVTTKVCKSSGMQFQKDNGELYNNEELYSTNSIKSITLIMNENNKNQPIIYEGTSAAPTSDSVSPLVTFSATGVNTYQFSSGKAFFRIGASASGAVNIDTIIIELEDSADSVLEEARLAALSILTDLSGNCGDGGSGVVTLSEWNTLNSNLAELDLSDDAKALLKDAQRILIGNLSQGGAEIENAMAHYDACVTKFHYTPFAGITNAQPSVVSNPLSLFNSNGATATTVIIIISVIGVSALGGFFFLRKRKEI